MFSAENTGPIFTKILHDIVALVASSSKTKPFSHLANMQRMHVVSFCLHYLVATATSLDRLENKVRKALSYGENIAKIGPVNPEIFDEICRTTT